MSLNSLAFYVDYHMRKVVAEKMPKIFATIDVEELLSGNGAADTSLSGVSDAIDTYGQGSYSILTKLGVFVAAVCLVIFFISLMLGSGNAMKVAAKKDQIPWLALGIIGLFAVGLILVFLQNIGVSLLS